MYCYFILKFYSKNDLKYIIVLFSHRESSIVLVSRTSLWLGILINRWFGSVFLIDRILLKWLVKVVRCLPTQLYFGWLEKWNEQYRRGMSTSRRGVHRWCCPPQEGGPAAVLPPLCWTVAALGCWAGGLRGCPQRVHSSMGLQAHHRVGNLVRQCVCTGHHTLRTSRSLRVWSLVWSTVIAQCAKWSVQLSGGDLCLVRVRCNVAGAGRRIPRQSGH